MSTTRSSRPPTRASKRPPAKRRASKPPKRRRAAKSWRWKIALAALFACFALGVLGLVGIFSYYGRDLPTVAALKNYRPPQVTRIVDRHGNVINEMFDERRTVVPMERIPRVLVLSVLAAEDADFYLHRGLDYAGILRAVLRDVVSGRAMQGASTITQQIVKNVLLTSERTISRKVKELILARRLEQELSKDEILWLYLNHIYFGHGRYGVQEASRFYFGKDVEDITLAEASLIAGIPQAPSRLSPLSHPEAARTRQLYVLSQLQSKRAQYWDDLTDAQIDKARNTKVKLAKANRDEAGAPEIVSTAKEFLANQVGTDRAKLGGYTVETTLDLSLQRAARKALRDGLITIDQRQGFVGPLHVPKKPTRIEPIATLRSGRTYDAVVTSANDETGEIELNLGGHHAIAQLEDVARFNPKSLSASTFAPKGAVVRAMIDRVGSGKTLSRARLALGPQGAVIVIDVRSREVLALVGGDEAEYGFNRALQAVRQPGSTFKPLVYALALESEKYTPATLVLDAPEVFDEWQPNNYETWHYAGAVRLREGLARSINLVAVRVIQDVTPEAVVKFAQSLGITSPLDPSLALALGASDVKPIELVNAYATFAAGGRYQPAAMVRRVTKANGEALRLPSAPAPQQALRVGTAYLMTSMLRSVVEEGTARRARALKRPVAGKTGTSNQARDAWFVGFTPELVAGVWVGFDDHRPLGRKESGGGSALPIWIEVMRAALGDQAATEFPVPSDIERAKIDPATGLLAYEGQEDAIEEVFLAGTVPTTTATPPDAVDTDTFLMEQL